jgi:glycosyltransferase involved in cell wall biosynthesis
MSHAAVIVPSLDQIGGAERQAVLLAKGMCQRGWRVSAVALSGSGGMPAEELKDAGVEFVSLEMCKGLADPQGWIRFHRWLRRERPEVLHAHLPHAAWMARWSRIAAHVPVVVDTLHSSSTGTIGRHVGYVLSQWLSDRVTAVSRATALAHLSAGMVNEKNLSIVPNGVDTQTWQPDPQVRAQMRSKLGLTDEFLWLAAGRLTPVKDYPTLLRAMAKAPKNARLVILGDGSLLNALSWLVIELGLERQVIFAGFDTDVRRWMHTADGFVLASRYEGLPMVLLEAGACGLPAVATDVPGTHEVIVNGETGWLACAEGPDALAAVMKRMMRMPEAERRAMGQRARQYVVERFSLNEVLDQWERLYTELLDRRTKRNIRLRSRESFTRHSATQA